MKVNPETHSWPMCTQCSHCLTALTPKWGIFIKLLPQGSGIYAEDLHRKTLKARETASPRHKGTCGPIETVPAQTGFQHWEQEVKTNHTFNQEGISNQCLLGKEKSVLSNGAGSLFFLVLFSFIWLWNKKNIKLVGRRGGGELGGFERGKEYDQNILYNIFKH